MPRGAPSPPQQFVSTDPSDPELTSAVDALAPTYTTSQGAPASVHRRWVDTFDRRLARAGMVLVETRRDGATSLDLTDDDGRRLASSAAPPAWPAFTAALPAGEVRESVGPLLDIRALTVVAELRSREREIRVLDADTKTVARLVVDTPVGRTYQHVPTVVRLRAVRGYQADADRIAGLLVAAPGVAAKDGPRHEDAAVPPTQSTDTPAAPPRPLSADQPAREAVIAVLAGFRSTIEANVPGLLDDIDTEFLHDFRVAVRRARSTLKLTGQVLPADLSEHLASELKWLGDLTSPTRDLDVYLLGSPAMAASLQPAAAEDLLAFQQHLEQRRAVEQRRLVRGVRSRRFRDLLDRWKAMDAAALEDAPRGKTSTAGELGRTSVEAARRRVVKLGSRIGPDSPAEDLHTLRKRCKELRYLLEIFAPLADRGAHKQVLTVLKALQECLGDFQDSEVQADALRRFAVDMAAEGTAEPPTLLAMGELAGALHLEQRRARSEFEGTFARFMAARNQQAFDRLAIAS